MADRASEWSGKTWGLATGFVGAFAIGFLNLSWRVCGTDFLGPKTVHILVSPFAPMDTPATVLSVGQYCVPALSHDSLTVLPWIVGIVLAGAGYLIGDVFDKRSAAAKRSHPE